MSVFTFYGSVTCVPPVQTPGQLNRQVALRWADYRLECVFGLARPFNPHMLWSVKRLGW
jgi:hypothetical protein